jgi:hypothetical protein
VNEKEIEKEGKVKEEEEYCLKLTVLKFVKLCGK